ncbi:Berberine bridge enzyme-like 13 [Camellia lanceoleosa]|uniref:Berberine bridge enzyme-like 13 n=1 Tax=Camellia lanceoleosa TaxID=1840588 RepID=A0ACC0GM68_9ERIC|nr:Berberine bridge enzyme-like 13 [Camellia lanceoleosa]
MRVRERKRVAIAVLEAKIVNQCCSYLNHLDKLKEHSPEEEDKAHDSNRVGKPLQNLRDESTQPREGESAHGSEQFKNEARRLSTCGDGSILGAKWKSDTEVTESSSIVGRELEVEACKELVAGLFCYWFGTGMSGLMFGDSLLFCLFSLVVGDSELGIAVGMASLGVELGIAVGLVLSVFPWSLLVLRLLLWCLGSRKWKIKLLAIPETVTVFTVNRTLEQNATKLVHRWQYVADKIDENLLLRLFLRRVNSSTQRGKVTVQASFVSLYLGGVDRLLRVMQESFPELGLAKEDCIEMSWIESILYFVGFSGQSPDILLNRTSSLGASFKGKSDFVTEPISEKGLNTISESYKNLKVDYSEILFSPYGGRISEISESETPFPHRSGTIYNIHYVVVWAEEGKAALNRHMTLTRWFYSFMAPYVSKSPRAAYLNYRDLDLGVNNKGNTSYTQASIWGLKYYRNNFKRLVHVKSMVDPGNFFRNEQSIPAV